jgi:hypothetical protein
MAVTKWTILQQGSELFLTKRVNGNFGEMQSPDWTSVFDYLKSKNDQHINLLNYNANEKI